MTYKLLVKTFVDLPTNNNTIGDVRLVLFEKKLYTWDGSAWILNKDLSPYVDKILTIKGEI